MTHPARALVSEQDYLATMVDERPALEFVKGEVLEKPAPSAQHQQVSLALTERFLAYRRRAGGTYHYEATANLSRGADRPYRVSDCAYWAPGRVAAVEGVFQPPTLAVRTRSPGQSRLALRDRCREYRDRGVGICWLIDPERRTVEVFEETRDGEVVPDDGVLESPLLPDFALPVRELWAELD